MTNNVSAFAMFERAQKWKQAAERNERLARKAVITRYPAVAAHLRNVARSYRIIARREEEKAQQISPS